MLRLLLILFVLYVVFTLTAKARRLVNKSKDRKESDGKMVKCSVCDVYLPSSEAKINGNGAFFCDQHASDSNNDRDASR